MTSYFLARGLEFRALWNLEEGSDPEIQAPCRFVKKGGFLLGGVPARRSSLGDMKDTPCLKTLPLDARDINGCSEENVGSPTGTLG